MVVKKSLSVLIGCLLSHHVFSQAYFEKISLPDSMYLKDFAINQDGHIFCAANTFSQVRNNGILRSIDQGLSWELVGTFGSEAPIKLCINESDEIYALKRSGNENLFRSTDNGTSWSALSIPTSPDWLNQEIFWHGNDTLFVTQNSNTDSRLLRTINDGQSWDSIFSVSVNTQTITGIAINSSGEIFLSVYSYFPNQGGLYRSSDNGISWELFGFNVNYIIDLEFNSLGDLFFTSLGLQSDPGLFVINSGEETAIPILLGPLFSSIGINNNNEIFSGSTNCSCIYHSSDNGVTYEWIEQNSILFPINILKFDSEQFLYVASNSTTYILRSIESTITATKFIDPEQSLIYPNPFTNQLTGEVDIQQNGLSNFAIYDQMGRALTTGQIVIFEGKFTLDIQNLPSGHYYLVIFSSENLRFPVVKL